MELQLVQLITRYWADAGAASAMAAGLYALKLAGNHLRHIQKSSQDVSDGIQRLYVAMQLHDTHERDHHEVQTVLLTSILNKK